MKQWTILCDFDPDIFNNPDGNSREGKIDERRFSASDARVHHPARVTSSFISVEPNQHRDKGVGLRSEAFHRYRKSKRDSHSGVHSGIVESKWNRETGRVGKACSGPVATSTKTKEGNNSRPAAAESLGPYARFCITLIHSRPQI